MKIDFLNKYCFGLGWCVLLGLMSHSLVSQCSFTISKANENAAFEQWFVLVDANADTIVAAVAADAMTGATFSTPMNGAYNVHALNYDPLSPPVPFPAVGDDPTLVGSISGCFNANFGSDIKPIDCICETQTVSASYNAATGYNVIYVLAQTDGTILAHNTTGAFSSADGLVAPSAYVFALHYNSTDPPSPIVGSSPGDLMAGDNVSAIGSVAPGCFTPLDNPLCVFLNNGQTDVLMLDRVCAGNMIYAVDPNNPPNAINIPNISFEWSLGGTSVGTTTSPYYSPQTPGAYTVNAIDDANCTEYTGNFEIGEVIDCKDCGN